MTRVLRALGITAVLIVVCSLLGAGSAGAAGGRAARAGDAMTGAPAVGACYDLTYKQAWDRSAAESTVSCSRRHTMTVVAVGTLPAGYDWATIGDKKLPIEVGKAVARTCGPGTKRHVAGPVVLARTLWSEWFYAPTKEQVDAGARWFSCEVALLSATRFLPVPAGQPKRIGGKIPSSVAKCARKARGGYPDVPCSTRHQWRATYSVLVHKRSADKPAQAAALRICPQHVGKKGDWLWNWRYQTKQSFVLTCLRKTKH